MSQTLLCLILTSKYQKLRQTYLLSLELLMFCAMFQLESAMEPLRIWYVYAF